MPTQKRSPQNTINNQGSKAVQEKKYPESKLEHIDINDREFKMIVLIIMR